MALPEGIDIEIRNCNPQIGHRSSSWFPPDIQYVTQQIDKLKPDIILACGSNAKKAISNITVGVPVIYMPHPAYRALKRETVNNVKEQISEIIRNIECNHGGLTVYDIKLVKSGFEN